MKTKTVSLSKSDEQIHCCESHAVLFYRIHIIRSLKILISFNIWYVLFTSVQNFLQIY